MVLKAVAQLPPKIKEVQYLIGFVCIFNLKRWTWTCFLK